MHKFPTSFTSLLVFTCALLAVWPVPGTIGLRNVLLGVLLITLVWSLRQIRQPSCTQSWPKWPILFFLLLTAWILLVIVGWSVEPALSWREFWGQWTLPALCGLAGALVANQALKLGELGRQQLIGTVFYTFFALVLLHDLLDAAYWFSTGKMPFRQAPVFYLQGWPGLIAQGDSVWSGFNGQFGEKFSFVNNTFAALLLAEIIQRVMRQGRLIQVSNLGLWVGCMSVLLCSYWLSFRNGNIGLLAMLTMAGFLVLVRIRNRISIIKTFTLFATGLALLAGTASIFWKSDARWVRFSETLPIAWNTEKYHSWLSTNIEPYPLLSDGQPVDGSAYDRVSWIKEGVKLALESPLGTGINRTAFFDGIDRKFKLGGTVRGGHAHSGVVDFTIANGFPGIALWLAFLASMAWIGWKAFRDGEIAIGLMLMFLISGFFSRSLVDSNIRDHVLQQFLFMVAVFLILANNLKNLKINRE